MITKIIATATARDVTFYEAVETTRKATVRLRRPCFGFAYILTQGERAIWRQNGWL